jgi:hypothetical protein
MKKKRVDFSVLGRWCTKRGVYRSARASPAASPSSGWLDLWSLLAQWFIYILSIPFTRWFYVKVRYGFVLWVHNKYGRLYGAFNSSNRAFKTEEIELVDQNQGSERLKQIRNVSRHDVMARAY